MNPEKNSLKRLPEDGRSKQFVAKNQRNMALDKTFSKMMAIVFRCLFFIEVICE
jgi:hypothetical protein